MRYPLTVSLYAGLFSLSLGASPCNAISAETEKKASIVAETSLQKASEKKGDNPSDNQPASPKNTKETEEEGDDDDGIYDPFEDWNRAVFAFNQMLNTIFWDPLVTLYEFVMPDFVQHSVRNILNHASLPLSLLNDIFQFDGDKFSVHLARLLINSGFGLGGLVDVCEMLGVTQEREDFGKTLKKVGVGPGFYMVLPILGPSNARDSFGRLTDAGVQYPFFYADMIVIGQYTAEYMHAYLDYRGSLDQVEKSLMDPYLTVRNLYYQLRGDIDGNTFFNDMEDDEDDAKEKKPEGASKEDVKEEKPAKKPAQQEGSLWDGVEDFADVEENVLSSTEEEPEGEAEGEHSKKDTIQGVVLPKDAVDPLKEEPNL